MSEGADILVLGATSLVGRFLLPRLGGAGKRAVALSRGPQPPVDSVSWFVGDLKNPSTLERIGPKSQVFSLSPIWFLPPALSTLRDLGLKELVAFSSTSRFTKAASTSQSERQVAETLTQAEAAVESFCRNHGVGLTLLRPTLIYAEGQDANVSRLAGLIRRFGFAPLAGGAKGLRQPVHADDLAALALLAMAGAPAGRAYNAPGGETLTYRTMVERIFEGLDRSPRLLALPLPLVQLGYALARPLLPGSSAQMITRMNEDMVFDPADIRRDFDWAPRAFHPNFRKPYSS